MRTKIRPSSNALRHKSHMDTALDSYYYATRKIGSVQEPKVRRLKLSLRPSLLSYFGPETCSDGPHSFIAAPHAF